MTNQNARRFPLHTPPTVRLIVDCGIGEPITSEYFDRFYTPRIGVTSLALLRLLIRTARDNQSTEIEVTVEHVAAGLGISPSLGAQGVFNRTLTRCQQFRLIQQDNDGTYRTSFHHPRLADYQIDKLHESLIEAHARYITNHPE